MHFRSLLPLSTITLAVLIVGAGCRQPASPGIVAQPALWLESAGEDLDRIGRAITRQLESNTTHLVVRITALGVTRTAVAGRYAFQATETYWALAGRPVQYRIRGAFEAASGKATVDERLPVPMLTPSPPAFPGSGR